MATTLSPYPRPDLASSSWDPDSLTLWCPCYVLPAPSSLSSFQGAWLAMAQLVCCLQHLTEPSCHLQALEALLFPARGFPRGTGFHWGLCVEACVCGSQASSGPGVRVTLRSCAAVITTPGGDHGLMTMCSGCPVWIGQEPGPTPVSLLRPNWESFIRPPSLLSGPGGATVLGQGPLCR